MVSRETFSHTEFEQGKHGWRHTTRDFSCQPARSYAQRARPRVIEISIGIIVVEGCRKGIGRSRCNSVRNMSLNEIHAATLSHYSARKCTKIENPPFRAKVCPPARSPSLPRAGTATQHQNFSPNAKRYIFLARGPTSVTFAARAAGRVVTYVKAHIGSRSCEMPTDRREAKNVMKGTIALTLQNGMICEAIHPEGDAIFRTSGISTRFAMTSPIVRGDSKRDRPVKKHSGKPVEKGEIEPGVQCSVIQAHERYHAARHEQREGELLVNRPFFVGVFATATSPVAFSSASGAGTGTAAPRRTLLEGMLKSVMCVHLS